MLGNRYYSGIRILQYIIIEQIEQSSFKSDNLLISKTLDYFLCIYIMELLIFV